MKPTKVIETSKNKKHRKKSKKRKSQSKEDAESSPSSASDSEKEASKRPSDSPNDSKKKQKTENEIIESETKVTKEGNMIVLESSSEMWKINAEKSSGIDEVHSREEDFENYLEDLLL